MRIVLALLAALGATGLSGADVALSPNSRSGPKWVFQLLPRSLQRRPELEIWVFTEQTPRGLQLPAPSPDEPMYFVAESGGYHSRGEAVAEKPPTAGALGRVLRSTLHSQGLLPADEAHPATLLLVYTWGSHNREIIAGQVRGGANPMGYDDSWNRGTNATNSDYLSSLASDAMTSRLGAQTRIPTWNVVNWDDDRPAAMSKSDQVERAALLVGDSFARQFRQDVASLPEDDGPDGPAMGQLLTSARRHPRGGFLARTINQSLYFTVVTAYDARRLSDGRREALWRTKIAVTSDGISLVETMPSMLLVAAPLMGRDTGAGALIQRRLDRRGNVVIGEPEVIGWESGEPEKSPKKEGAKP